MGPGGPSLLKGHRGECYPQNTPEKPKRKRRDRDIPLMPLGYQPSVREKDEEIDMPSADDKTTQRAFFDAAVSRNEKPDWRRRRRAGGPDVA